MNTTLEPRLMPAQNTTDPAPTTGPVPAATPREGVKSVAIFESRRSRVPRAWDELTELDRLVLLESVRQRRKVQDQKQRIYTEMYGLRSNR